MKPTAGSSKIPVRLEMDITKDCFFIVFDITLPVCFAIQKAMYCYYKVFSE